MIEIEEQDFYQCDFTTASLWEIFIARLEEIIREWKLSKVKNNASLTKDQWRSGEWEHKTENIDFADSKFILTWYYLKSAVVEETVSPLEEDDDECEKCPALDDIMSLENTFLPQNDGDNGSGITVSYPHPLSRWYGLREFLVISPARGTPALSVESKVKVLLSSVYIALNNSNCHIPVFVQIHESSQHYYMGVCEGKGLRTEFEMIHLKTTPSHCRYLTGLLNLFKSKVSSALPLEPITLSVRITYVLRDWASSAWTQEPPDFDFLHGETFGVAELGKLPFGAVVDPLSELHLFAIWPQLMENVVVDNETYSDFDPAQAPLWSMCVKMTEQPVCLLSEYLNEFIHSCKCQNSMHDLLGDIVDKGSSNLSSSLNALTEPRVPTISKMIKKKKRARQQGYQEGPITDETLMPILYFLFPDADENPKYPYIEQFGNNDVSENKQNEDTLSGLKSAPMDCLVWRLSVVMSHVIHTLGGIKAAAHLWYEFAQEMRYRLEKDILIPGIDAGFPDHRTCLLHQKLQLLNCCIERKRAREKLAKSGSLEEDLDSDSGDEEFFDCSTDLPKDEAKSSGGSIRRQKHSLWNRPTGRLEKHGNLRLLKTGEHLYIPVTQDPTPKTEDQIEEDANILLELGTDSQAAQLRARLMSASLLSDMESFKAANPGSVLDDFIRWYSPRDWIEENEVDEYGQKKGTLSPRMQIKDNMWVEAWEAAKPVPARRQKRLFDDTRESEKVLHFLESRKMSDVVDLLMPALIHASLSRLMEVKKDELPGLSNMLHRLVKRAEKLTRKMHLSYRDYEEWVSEMASAEATVAQVNSLEHKFRAEEGSIGYEEFQIFLSKLMQQPEVEVPGGPRGVIGTRIKSMFAEAQKNLQMLSESDVLTFEEEPWNVPSSTFPQPMQREFVLRVMASRPSSSCTPSPQRMTAILKKNEFRIAGCFTHDTAFL